MDCWICKEKTEKSNLCSCNNDFSYCHYKCIEKYVSYSNNYKCIFCNSNYKLSHFFWIKYYFYLFINFLYKICEYDLYTGVRWDDY